MSKKTLLNENTVRRFMKLALIEPLTENFVEKNKEEIEEGPMGVYARDDEPGLPPAPEELEEPVDVDMGPEELGGEEEAPSGDGLTQAEVEEKVEDLAQMFLDNVEELFGVSGEVSTSEEEPLGDLEGPGDEVLDVEAGDEFPPEEDLEGDLEEGSGDRNDPRNDRGNQRQKEGSAGNPGEYLEERELEKDIYKNLVNNITSKVASRLTEIKKTNKEKADKSKKIDRISDKIVKRVFSFVKK